MNTSRLLLLLGLVFAGAARADGPRDNIPDNVRPVPPPGIEVSDAERKVLEHGLSTLAQEIRRLRKNPAAVPHLPDVEIYYQAVRIALDHGEFFAPADIEQAKKLLVVGGARARELGMGKTPWLVQPGPTALGYISALDGSTQPYGLFIPPTFSPTSPQRWRLDAWFHGRDEKLSELKLVNTTTQGVMKKEFLRPDAFFLQPYGRFCNAGKLAGEVDFLEALADVKRRFRIDEDRVVVRGFSMGGATTWQLAAHYASDWAAAAPGAGFAETAEFLKVFQDEVVKPSWWEQKLWGMYDAPAYAENFRNVPLVAYSGEIDKQKQAADLMAGVLAKVGIPMTHIIGPKTAHAYHADSVLVVNRLVDALAVRGRDPAPRRVSLATPTLKYNRQAWVTVDAMGRHWDKASVEAEIVADGQVQVATKNVTAITLAMTAGRCPFALGRTTTVRLDGQKLPAPAPMSDRSWTASFHRSGTRWLAGVLPAAALQKRHDLQGPIDDAFLSSFLMVTVAEGAPFSKPVGAWVTAEQMHAIKEWRHQFRGEPRVKRDIDVTPEDIAQHNLILWGDPGSNQILKQIADKLPIRWTKEGITAGKKSYAADKHALVAIYPNPLNPKRYVVLNSGFTYREYDYLNNARQVPKLPDWAIVDISTPPNSRYPGKIADAGFFGEQWEYKDRP